MEERYPSKVLITGGRETGGVGSFAEGLRTGFAELGIPAEIVRLHAGHFYRALLFDPRILKILSTGAVFAAPFARRALCMAHGVPRADCQGWRMPAIIASYKLANLSPGAQLVSVSHYTASTLRAVFNIRTDAVVHNPLKPLYIEPASSPDVARRYLTYVGRLTKAKNLDRILPAIRLVLDENPDLRACILGKGEQFARLQAIVGDDARFEFPGEPNDLAVRSWLRRTRVFVSGNEVEGFGIAYLEALSQGCAVAMPASGGGLEIALEQIGNRVQLFSASMAREAVAAALRRALKATPDCVDLASYSPRAVAEAYLAADAHFNARGIFHPAAPYRTTEIVRESNERSSYALSLHRHSRL